MEEQHRDTIGSKHGKHSLCVICGDTTAHRVACEDPAQRMQEQQRDLLHHRETISDPQTRSAEQQMNNM